MRDFIWIVGAILASTALYFLFGHSLVFTLVGVVGVARAVLIVVAEYREKKLYQELENLNFEERRQLLEKAGHQGLVKRSPPVPGE